jgi:phenylalanine ammonia-lyase
MKGVDISMASYMSELGFLANSVTSHVQSAEMHNQPINSLALISARYTLQAVELVSMMSAALLYVVCQGLDLRLLHETFLNELDSVVQSALRETLNSADMETMKKLQTGIIKAIRASWKESARSDLPFRIQGLSTAIAPVLLTHAKGLNVEEPVATIESVQKRICLEAQSLYETARSRTFSGELNAEASLGSASKSLYRFVRRDLNVPFHCGLLEHPTIDSKTPGVPQRPRKTIGSWISIIYEAIRDGRIRTPLA